MNDKKETAQEVPVQEQPIVKISFEETLLKSKLERIDSLVSELNKEINSLPSTVKVTCQTS